MIIKRGYIYLAALDPVVDNQIAKTRPVTVVSNDKNNEFSGTVTVLPLTSKNLHIRYLFDTSCLVFFQPGRFNPWPRPGSDVNAFIPAVTTN